MPHHCCQDFVSVFVSVCSVGTGWCDQGGAPSKSKVTPPQRGTPPGTPLLTPALAGSKNRSPNPNQNPNPNPHPNSNPNQNKYTRRRKFIHHATAGKKAVTDLRFFLLLGFCALMCRLELKHTCGYSNTCAQSLYSTHIQLSLAKMHWYCSEGGLGLVSHAL